MAKIIPIEEDNVLKAHKEGTPEIKKLLENLCGITIFKRKPLMELMTFEDVCEAAGEDADDYELLPTMSYKEKADMGMDRLMLYEKVFNGDKPVDMADITRRRYYPWHQTIVDSKAPAGFALSFGGCDCDFAIAILGARPEFNDEAHARFVGTQHIGEYETWAQNFQLSKTNL